MSVPQGLTKVSTEKIRTGCVPKTLHVAANVQNSADCDDQGLEVGMGVRSCNLFDRNALHPTSQ